MIHLYPVVRRLRVFENQPCEVHKSDIKNILFAFRYVRHIYCKNIIFGFFHEFLSSSSCKLMFLICNFPLSKM